MVYVLSKDKKPLMPCENVVARLLLKDGKAKVVRKNPFIIKLTYETTTYTQPLTLGMDTGSGKLSVAVATEPDDEDGIRRILYISEVEVRNDIKDKMKERRDYRRSRRNRKTRYRKKRFDNRGNSKKKGRTSPTVNSKIHSHVREIEFVKSILPVTNIIVENGQFDPHLMKNPKLKYQPWGYQKGPNYGFENSKAMVRNRDHYTCQYCGKTIKDAKLEVHHIVFKSNGGSDEPENLITLCHGCHTKLHAGKINPNFESKTSGALKYATQMNHICKKLFEYYPEAVKTFGYVTSANRNNLKLQKEHYIDACVVASGGKNFNIECDLLLKKHVSDGDFKQTSGRHSEKKLPRGKINGFRKFDKVKYLGQEYFIKGRMSSGYAVLMDISGKTVKFDNAPKGFKTPKFLNMKRVSARSTCLITNIKLM